MTEQVVLALIVAGSQEIGLNPLKEPNICESGYENLDAFVTEVG